MARLHIITEGSTEENFVRDVLAPWLSHIGIYADAHSITTRRDYRKNRLYRGGLDNIEHLLKDIRLWLAQEQNNPDCWITTMVDLYAFPYEDRPQWAVNIERLGAGIEKAIFIEQQLLQEFSNFRNFIPYVQLHEYEALLLTDTSSIHHAFEDHYDADMLEKLNRNIGTLMPEEVNQGRHSAPSKRIIQFYPEYEDNKPVWGSLIAQEIGITAMRSVCPHFNEWVTRLEAL
jgi:hypothetical protein